MIIRAFKQNSVLLIAASLILSLACAGSAPASGPVVTPEPSPESSSTMPPVSSSEPIPKTPALDLPPSTLQAEFWPGYTLVSPAGINQAAYLIDMDGLIVHEWPINGNPAKMLQDGSLLGSKRTRREGVVSSERQSTLGGRDFPDVIELVQVSWNGQEEWSFSNWDSDDTGIKMSRQHHDYQREGNPTGYFSPGQEFIAQGKTLVLARENKLIPEISIQELELDVIYEVDWEGNFTGFEWHATDHFDEMGFDESARKAIHDGLTYNEDKDSNDWLHINSMSLLGQNHWYDEAQDERFNPENIIISSRNANFLAIISKTTGDVVWRAGPDFSKGTPEHDLGQFVGQHHAHMIPNGLPGQGNILVFDNGGRSGYGGPTGYPRYTRHFSRVIEFNPVTLEIVWQYGSESGEDQFFSRSSSSAQRLPNGNTLITDGTNGRIIEVTTEKKKVWEFNAPASDRGNNAIYRAYRIPPEWVPSNPSGYVEWSKLFSLDESGQVLPPESSLETTSAFVIVDTGQNKCYDNSKIISCPQPSQAFYGQDAQYEGKQPVYQDNGDNTVTDMSSGLMWQQDPGDKMTYNAAVAGTDDFSLAGYDDWRLPTIKELYSLILFSGTDPSSPKDTTAVPFINTDYFDFRYGDTSAGERIIDSQYVSRTKYVSTTMRGDETVFGVNFADGRIKGYPIKPMRNQPEGKEFFVQYVRGNPDYGNNIFNDNEDGTITDSATGLMWSQSDSGEGMDWESALAWVQQRNDQNYLGYDDWRLPNAKELQSIVDYTRSPDTTNSAAIDSLFEISEIINEDGNKDYPFFWTGTTHVRSNGIVKSAVYLSFGRALGHMNDRWLDVHGAGAQRSDPKSGDPDDYPTYKGPQGDVRRLLNYVRCVRDDR